jgi:DNA-binding NarL/FixJ family response regulator
MSGTIDVLLVDDHQMVLEGLAALVSRDPLIRVVGQCQDATKVLQSAEELRPHVVVLDIGMPGINGLDLCRELTRKLKQTAVLMLTMYDDQEFMKRALIHGASGYVVKGAPGQELLQAIHAVASGGRHLPAGVPADLAESAVSLEEDPYDLLTSRERQVFQMIAEGRKTRQIAEELHVAVKTVDAHRTRMMRKLGIHNVGDLVKLALKRGIVHLP